MTSRDPEGQGRDPNTLRARARVSVSKSGVRTCTSGGLKFRRTLRPSFKFGRNLYAGQYISDVGLCSPHT